MIGWALDKETVEHFGNQLIGSFIGWFVMLLLVYAMMDRKQYSSVISIMRMREIEEPPSAQDEMVEVEDGADLEDLDSQLGRSKDEQMQKILEISQKQTWILEHLMASGAISVDRVKAF